MRKIYLLFLPLFFSFAGLHAQEKNQFVFTSKPYLQNMQATGTALFWEVNRSAVSWVEYGETEKLGSKAQMSHWGMYDVAEGIQKVRLEKLTPGKKYYYRAASCEVKTLEPYKVIYGDTIFSAVYNFTTPSKGAKNFSFLAFNDLHNKPVFIEDVVKRESDFDFAVFNGDIVTDVNRETSLVNKIYSPLADYFATGKPVYFIRGNHETRGGTARSLYKYFDTPNDKYYYTFTRGNTFFIMLDCGEDKPDNNKYYYGLADYDSYRTEEAKWLEQVVKTPEFKNAKFKIVCIHMPVTLKPGDNSEEEHGVYDCSKKFAPILNKAGIDLLLCGHTHKYEVIKASKETNRFPVIVGGRHWDPKNPGKTTYTKVDVSSNRITAYLKNAAGELIDKVEIKK
jgi:predicted MPP superfamily phosphohydrolase